jgi:hypothetical protein
MNDDDELSRNARLLGDAATAWMDTLWDPEVRLLRHPDPNGGGTHMVRETSWYAIGLLSRNGAGDAERAVEAIGAVLAQQFDAPRTPYHGTWRRRPDEPDPPADPLEWRDYDPNWREFIGSALLLVLHEFEAVLPAELIERIERALSLATAGALARAVPPSYTNIALMGAYLFDAVGHRQGVVEPQRAGELLARQVHDLWSRTGTFPEFNSPTYYGVDLFALALWRSHAPSTVLRRLGVDLEQRLWREIATRYHPDLRNMAGPYDRAYGMDMRRYVALLGLWIGLVVGAERAPLPAGGPSTGTHTHDWCFAPCVALLAAAPPAEAAARLAAVPGAARRGVGMGELVTTVIGGSPRRVATSWIGPRHTVGAQDAAGTRDGADGQYCPLVVHWSAPGPTHDVSWLRVASAAPVGVMVDATVDDAGVLHVTHHRGTGRERLCFEAYAPHADPAELTADQWRLPGLTVRPDTPIDVLVTKSGGLLRIECAPPSPPSPPSSGADGPLRLSLHVSAP